MPVPAVVIFLHPMPAANASDGHDANYVYNDCDACALTSCSQLGIRPSAATMAEQHAGHEPRGDQRISCETWQHPADVLAIFRLQIMRERETFEKLLICEQQ